MDLERDNLFRRESGRLVAVLTRLFGVHNLALAEDVAQDTLCAAFEIWSLEGIPEHHSAWLTTAAKNRALDVLRKASTAKRLEPALTRQIEAAGSLDPRAMEALFEPHIVPDHQLRMMFTCCHPKLSEDTQVALVLSILCGFSAAEIARAFLVTTAAMEKRIARAKAALAETTSLFELTAVDIEARIGAVQRGLYVLFSEGYHGGSSEGAVRKELCHEARYLTSLLLGNALTATPSTYALYALMSIHASRLEERIDEAGNIKTLFQQDRARWDVALVAEGLRALERSASGDAMSEYHVEAAIASLHTAAPSAAETRWGEIVSLYDVLMAIRPSPVVAMNRAIAIAEHEGPERGLEALHAIEDPARLASYPFYAAALGELERRRGAYGPARAHFARAAGLARSDVERRFLEERVASCCRSVFE